MVATAVTVATVAVGLMTGHLAPRGAALPVGSAAPLAGRPAAPAPTVNLAERQRGGSTLLIRMRAERNDLAREGANHS